MLTLRPSFTIGQKVVHACMSHAVTGTIQTIITRTTREGTTYRYEILSDVKCGDTPAARLFEQGEELLLKIQNLEWGDTVPRELME